MNRKQRKTVKVVTGVMGLCIIGYIVGPPMYWHLSEEIETTIRSSTCPHCLCDCSFQPLLSLPGGLINHSFIDCMKHNPEMSKETEKSFTEMLADELKVREAQSLEEQRRADRAILESKKVASQYQKEADKCNMGMETCEEAKEKAEATLELQRKLSAMWQLRARQKGWKDEPLKSSVD